MSTWNPYTTKSGFPKRLVYASSSKRGKQLQSKQVAGRCSLPDLQQDLRAEDKREEQFVLLKERATDIGVEAVGKMLIEISESFLQYLRLIAEIRKHQNAKLISDFRRKRWPGSLTTKEERCLFCFNLLLQFTGKVDNGPPTV